MSFENKGSFTATIVVAAADSLNPGQANYVCDGTNDHVEIQAALDALPASGGEVLLLEGTYYVESSITLNSYQILRGQGKGTILTTTTADLDIVTASSKVNITIADLCIDGDAGGVANDHGIYFYEVDYSTIYNVYSRDNGEDGINFRFSEYNRIIACDCQGNRYGIVLADYSHYNTVIGNTTQGNTEGILVYNCGHNTIANNVSRGNSDRGIDVYESAGYNTVTGNICEGNGDYGILIFRTDYNAVVGNSCNSNTGDGISVEGDATTNADYNTVTANICSGNGGDGISVEGGVDANKNIVLGNQLLGNTGNPLVDNGTNTDTGHNIVA